jgi:Mn-dependent DtxR family transcriptional regulator
MKYREGIQSERARDKSFKERQKEVFNALMQHGAMCNEQIADILNVFPHQVTPRVLELRRKGIIVFSGYGKSKTSGKTVSIWQVNKETTQIQIQYADK